MAQEVYNYIIDTGTIVADTSGVLAEVQSEYQTALGANINLASSTPQGTLIASETNARVAVMKNNAEMGNMINPNLAYGIFLDAICSLLGVTRGTNQSTVASGITFTGNSSVVIPAGSRVQTTNGDIFTVQSSLTIPGGGSIAGAIVSQAYGSIPVPPSSNLTILDAVVGWGGATIPSSPTVIAGTLALNDDQLKVARNQQLAIQGVGQTASIMAQLANVPNVTSALVVENNTGVTGSVNGITFTLPNAIWVCVDGSATNTAIAQALYDAHQGGCPWDFGGSGMGNPVSSPGGITVNDPVNQLPYAVKWTTPIYMTAYIYIQTHNANGTAYSAVAIQNAIMAYATGQEQGEPGLTIGASMSAFEISGAVVRQLPGIYVKLCQLNVTALGAPAPIYPTGYNYEFVAAPYQRVQLAIGNIEVIQI